MVLMGLNFRWYLSYALVTHKSSASPKILFEEKEQNGGSGKYYKIHLAHTGTHSCANEG